MALVAGIATDLPTTDLPTIDFPLTDLFTGLLDPDTVGINGGCADFDIRSGLPLPSFVVTLPLSGLGVVADADELTVFAVSTFGEAAPLTGVVRPAEVRTIVRSEEALGFTVDFSAGFAVAARTGLDDLELFLPTSGMGELPLESVLDFDREVAATGRGVGLRFDSLGVRDFSTGQLAPFRRF